jgi:hypothetical protein
LDLLIFRSRIAECIPDINLLEQVPDGIEGKVSFSLTQPCDNKLPQNTLHLSSLYQPQTLLPPTPTPIPPPTVPGPPTPATIPPTLAPLPPCSMMMMMMMMDDDDDVIDDDG